jgi:hypothetical protein
MVGPGVRPNPCRRLPSPGPTDRGSDPHTSRADRVAAAPALVGQTLDRGRTTSDMVFRSKIDMIGQK